MNFLKSCAISGLYLLHPSLCVCLAVVCVRLGRVGGDWVCGVGCCWFGGLVLEVGELGWRCYNLSEIIDLHVCCFSYSHICCLCSH